MKLHSENLAKELIALQYDDKGNVAAPSGAYDDEAVATAIAWQMRKRAGLLEYLKRVDVPKKQPSIIEQYKHQLRPI
jgi:hypothetical protein